MHDDLCPGVLSCCTVDECERSSCSTCDPLMANGCPDVVPRTGPNGWNANKEQRGKKNGECRKGEYPKIIDFQVIDK